MFIKLTIRLRRWRQVKKGRIPPSISSLVWLGHVHVFVYWYSMGYWLIPLLVKLTIVDSILIKNRRNMSKTYIGLMEHVTRKTISTKVSTCKIIVKNTIIIGFHKLWWINKVINDQHFFSQSWFIFIYFLCSRSHVCIRMHSHRCAVSIGNNYWHIPCV